jgi:hypothetical protein
MKKILLFIILLVVGGCTEEPTDETMFIEIMGEQFIDYCGEEDKECINAVKEQIEYCMKESDWRKIIDNAGDIEEAERFASEFSSCFKDSNGNSYFDANGKI